jgi:hypothetical protein
LALPCSPSGNWRLPAQQKWDEIKDDIFISPP